MKNLHIIEYLSKTIAGMSQFLQEQKMEIASLQEEVAKLKAAETLKEDPWANGVSFSVKDYPLQEGKNVTDYGVSLVAGYVLTDSMVYSNVEESLKDEIAAYWDSKEYIKDKQLWKTN